MPSLWSKIGSPIRSFIRKNPLVSAAIIAAIGTIIGALIPILNTDCPTCPSNCTTLIEHMEDRMMWHEDPQGKNFSKSVSAFKNNGIQINYDLGKNGDYVAIYKEIKSEKLVGTKGIRFHYSGSGAPNTIELVLVQKNSENEDARFVYPSNAATQTNNQWRTVEACYEDFNCWNEPRCYKEERPNPKKIYQIGLAISHQDKDTAGNGSVIVDEIESIIC